jgi:hypothetical protein
MRSAFAVFAALLVGVFVAGCSGPEEGFSGVPLAKRVGDLPEGEMRALCAWVIDQQGGEGARHDCGNGIVITLDTVDECVAEQGDYAGCALTVAQMEECVLEAGPDPCAAPSTPACQPLGECLFGP